MGRDNYVGDEGTEIILDSGEDLSQSGVNGVFIKYKKPDGSTGEWEGSVYASTKVKYVTKPGDLDQSGTWNIQTRVDSVTWKGLGRLVAFRVKRILQG